MLQISPEFQAVLESSAVPFVLYQYSDGKIIPVLVSDGLCRRFGRDRNEMFASLSASLYETIHPDDIGRVKEATEAFAGRRGDYDLFFRSRHEDGYHYIHAAGYWMDAPGLSDVAMLIYSDLTHATDEMKKLTDQYQLFRQDSFYRDSLTGLPNINYMQQFAADKVQSLRLGGKTPMLVYSDVNSMQFYNNQYGFARGDELLVLITKSISKVFPDALVIRAADDHFILIDACPGETETMQRMADVNREIREKAYGNTTGIQAGVCVLTPNMDVAAAIDHARNALKQIGSNLNTVCRFFSQQADEQYWAQRYIVQNLDRALEEGWIKVFYQGITRTRTEKTAFFEALARWNDPNHGTIAPAEFIPVLEKYHLLYKLDLYMVEHVFREIPIRKDAGLPLVPVSVNFSAQDFEYKDIPAEIEKLYTRFGVGNFVPRDYLVVEITERDMATASESFHGHLQTLRNMGYRIWLDDFGSGYSSLNVFSRFNVDLIKFDKELVRDLDARDGLNRKILRAMISIARDMGVHTLAEGVETLEQRNFLLEAGCELTQGFLFRRPESLSTILFKIQNGSIRPSCETSDERNRFDHFESNEEKGS